MIEWWAVEGGGKARVHLNCGEIGASKEKLSAGAKHGQWVTGSNKTCDLSIARRERKQQSLMGFLQSGITITYKAHTDTTHQLSQNTSISWQRSANKTTEQSGQFRLIQRARKNMSFVRGALLWQKKTWANWQISHEQTIVWDCKVKMDRLHQSFICKLSCISHVCPCAVKAYGMRNSNITLMK